MGDCFHWWNLVFWPPCLHEVLESMVLHYLEGLLTLWHPTNNFSPTKIWDQVRGKAQRWVYYLACFEVCWQWENVIFSFPIHSNWAVMEPSRNLVFVSTKRALSRLHVPSAASTALVPQQFLACRQSPLVDLASAVSKNLWTSCPFFPWHLPAAHTNTWTRQLFMYSTHGTVLKKT